MSNAEYLIWKDNRKLTQKLRYPAGIVVKISNKEEYYEGDLLVIRSYCDFHSDLFKEDISHRPTIWRNDTKASEWVFFIANLKNVSKPEKIKNKPFPEGKKEVIYF